MPAANSVETMTTRSQTEISLDGYDEREAPDSVLDYPSMTTKNEKSLLYWLAKHVFRGDGIIVDAGIFLGGSTNAFAQGIKDNTEALRKVGDVKPIHSYDMAVWVRSMDRYLDRPHTRRALKDRRIVRGENFTPVLKQLLHSHLDLIDFRIGDIVQLARTTVPVEIAFYDCLKTKERDYAVFAAFAPFYIPGRSIIIQQDYFYEGAPDSKIRQEYLKPYFSYLGGIATSAVFRLEEQIPKAYFENDPIEHLTIEEKVQLLRQCSTRTAIARYRLMTELSVVEFLLDCSEIAMASRELSSLEAKLSSLSADDVNNRARAAFETMKKRVGAAKSATMG